MKRLLLTAAVFCAPLAARADTAPTLQQPHPSVARIIAPDSDGTSYGSGSLIAVNEHYGIVVTNWHVIREVAGQIWVVFPGGFQSPATVMKIDRDWDLAALLIWKPNVQPLPVSTQAPLLGERLTIAGYGSGWYRAVSGRCIEYFSPGGNLPAEIVELSVPARNGDSGGPILNDRGEIAGVLFGSDSTSTMGSYCGRLRRFLAPLAGDFERLPPPTNGMIAGRATKPPVNQLSTNLPAAIQPFATQPIANLQRPNPTSANAAAAQMPQHEMSGPSMARNTQAMPESRESRGISAEKVLPNPARVAQIASQNRKAMAAGMETTGTTAKIGTSSVTTAIPPRENLGENDTLFGQLKTFLALIGLLALTLQALKILGKAAG